MRKILLILALTCVAGTQTKAQTLEIKKNGIITHNELQIKHKEVVTVMQSNATALKQYKSGYSMRLAGNIIGSAGAFFVGYDLGGRLAGSKGNDALLIGAGSATAVGIVLMLCGQQKIKQGIDLYNRDFTPPVSLWIESSPAGAALCLRF